MKLCLKKKAEFQIAFHLSLQRSRSARWIVAFHLEDRMEFTENSFHFFLFISFHIQCFDQTMNTRNFFYCFVCVACFRLNCEVEANPFGSDWHQRKTAILGKFLFLSVATYDLSFPKLEFGLEFSYIVFGPKLSFDDLRDYHKVNKWNNLFYFTFSNTGKHDKLHVQLMKCRRNQSNQLLCWVEKFALRKSFASDERRCVLRAKNWVSSEMNRIEWRGDHIESR